MTMVEGEKLSDFEIEKKANQLRLDTLDMCIKSETGHVTSSVCSAEILATLYYDTLKQDPQNPEWEGRDVFVLSKGQASPILYATLADKGYFPREHLDQFAKGVDGTGKDAPFGVHLQCTVPGVEFTTGSLGHGLGYAVGVAESFKLDGKDNHTYVLLGDGELYEGSNWEATGYATQHNLDNLIAIVDRNKMCTNHYTEKIVSLEPMVEKWKSYNWNVTEVDGHSVRDLRDVLNDARENPNGKPSVLIADTIKGQGIPSMTDKLYLHGIAPSGEGAELARNELQRYADTHLLNGGYNNE